MKEGQRLRQDRRSETETETEIIAQALTGTDLLSQWDTFHMLRALIKTFLWTLFLFSIGINSNDGVKAAAGREKEHCLIDVLEVTLCNEALITLNLS